MPIRYKTICSIYYLKLQKSRYSKAGFFGNQLIIFCSFLLLIYLDAIYTLYHNIRLKLCRN